MRVTEQTEVAWRVSTFNSAHSNLLRKRRRAKRSFTSRLRYQEHFLDKGIHWNTFYESGISNQPIRTFSYLEVPNGAGLYTWVDYNGNELQELNEFERAQLPGEGRFVKIYTPGRSLQEAGRTLVSQTLGIRPLAWVQNGAKNPFGRDGAASGAIVWRTSKCSMAN